MTDKELKVEKSALNKGKERKGSNNIFHSILSSSPLLISVRLIQRMIMMMMAAMTGILELGLTTAAAADGH